MIYNSNNSQTTKIMIYSVGVIIHSMVYVWLSSTPHNMSSDTKSLNEQVISLRGFA